MDSYAVTLNNDTGTGDNCWIELVPASGVQIAIYKITIGQTTTPGDTILGRLRVFRETTAAGASVVPGTVIEIDPTGSAPTTTCNVKQTGVFAASGTVTDTMLDIAFAGRQTLEWVATGWRNWLWSNSGERMIVRLVCAVSMGSASLTVYFKE